MNAPLPKSSLKSSLTVIRFWILVRNRPLNQRPWCNSLEGGSLLRKYGNQCIVKLSGPQFSLLSTSQARTDKVCSYTYVHILHLSSCCLATLSSNAMYVHSVLHRTYIERTYFLCWEIIWSLPNCVVARLYDVTCSSLSTVRYCSVKFHSEIKILLRQYSTFVALKRFYQLI